jgi:hypothetical protein
MATTNETPVTPVKTVTTVKPITAPVVVVPVVIPPKPATPTTTKPNRFEVGTVSNPRWADQAKTEIACVVTFPNNSMIPAKGVPFNARADDSEAHGSKLFNDLISGKYGAIAPYSDAALPPQQQYNNALGKGLVINSASDPTLNGRYPVSSADQSAIQSEAQYISEYQSFSAGTTTLAWADTQGKIHTFKTVAAFKAFAKAATQYVSGCKQARLLLQSGATATFPSNAFSIR